MLLLAAAVALALAASGSAPAPRVIGLEGGAAGLAVSSGRVWVAAPRAGEVVVLDAASGEPAGAAVRTGGAPARVALGMGSLWATDAAAGAVVPVQLRPPRIFASVQPGADANDVALAAGALWIASSADGRVYVVEPGGGTARPLPAGRGPVALAADDARVVAVDDRDGTLSDFDARGRRSLGAPISVGGAPVDVALAGDTAWVADAAGGRIVAVDLRARRVAETVAVGRRPVALAVAGEDVYVVSAGERTLLRVRGGKVQSRRTLSGEPGAIAVDDRYVWVTVPGADELLRFER